MHLGLDEAAAMIAAPFLPDRSPGPFRAVLLPWPSVAANRNDRVGMAPGNHSVTLFGIIGSIPADLSPVRLAWASAPSTHLDPFNEPLRDRKSTRLNSSH